MQSWDSVIVIDAGHAAHGRAGRVLSAMPYRAKDKDGIETGPNLVDVKLDETPTQASEDVLGLQTDQLRVL